MVNSRNPHDARRENSSSRIGHYRPQYGTGARSCFQFSAKTTLVACLALGFWQGPRGMSCLDTWPPLTEEKTVAEAHTSAGGDRPRSAFSDTGAARSPGEAKD
ncbi:MAG: hypothetical protein ACI9EF_000483 [Pseudohongiellaceae bacterium]|jgi:hypothetical protein